MFGAIAPLENVVVERSVALGTGVGGAMAAGDVAATESVEVGEAVVPAAESTHSFILVMDMRVMLSERARAAATVAGFVESTDAFGAGWRTKVVNWAVSLAGVITTETESARPIVTE